MSVQKCKEALGKDLYTKLRFEKKLSIKYIQFVAIYLTNGLDGKDAYLKSIARKGTKEESARVEAIRILQIPTVQEAVRDAFNDWLGEKKSKLEKQIIDNLCARAFYDPEIFYTPDGKVKFSSWEQIPKEYHCCVESMEVKYYGKDADKDVVVLRLADKSKAMKELSQYIELYKPSEIGLRLTDDTVGKLKTIFRKEVKE